MPYVIGTDEAGYGPNLGPLVVSATVWQLPEGASPADLFALTRGVIAPSAAGARDGRVAMADSKQLYKPGGGLRLLERGLLAALGVLQAVPDTWRGLWRQLAPGADAALAEQPWHRDYDAPLPADNLRGEIEAAADRLREGLAAVGVRLVAVCSRAVFPAEFNRLCDHYRNKGVVLSHVTLGLAAELARDRGPGPIHVLCDKHGGRNRYADLLADHFPDLFIEIHGESRERSVYRFGPPERRFEFRFQTGGEAHLEAALASMASKYLRELAMRAFNAFWRERVADLKPTAGYPQDARRFRQQIAAAQEKLGIADEILWRRR